MALTPILVACLTQSPSGESRILKSDQWMKVIHRNEGHIFDMDKGLKFVSTEVTYNITRWSPCYACHHKVSQHKIQIKLKIYGKNTTQDRLSNKCCTMLNLKNIVNWHCGMRLVMYYYMETFSQSSSI